MKALLLKVLTVITAVGLASPSLANIILSLEPTPQSISVGSPAAVDLVVSGLGDHTAPSLGGFSFDFSYNSAIVSAVSVTFGNFLDLGVLGSSRFSDLSTAGTIHLDEVSFETQGDLNSAQGSSFTLATLTFTGLAPGTSAIDFDLASLADEQGQSITGFSTIGGSIDVQGIAPVPEVAATVSLLIVGIASLSALRRSRSFHAQDERSERV